MKYSKHPDFPRYLVFEDGAVVREERVNKRGDIVPEKLIRPFLLSNGYWVYSLIDKNGHKRTVYAHRLAYEAFHRPIPEGLQIDHINGYRSDNTPLVNLRAVSAKANANNPVTKARYVISNAVENGKYDKERLLAARAPEREKLLKKTYLKIVKNEGDCSVYQLTQKAHCGYKRARRIINEMKRNDMKNEK